LAPNDGSLLGRGLRGRLIAVPGRCCSELLTTSLRKALFQSLMFLRFGTTGSQPLLEELLLEFGFAEREAQAREVELVDVFRTDEGALVRRGLGFISGFPEAEHDRCAGVRRIGVLPVRRGAKPAEPLSEPLETTHRCDGDAESAPPQPRSSETPAASKRTARKRRGKTEARRVVRVSPSEAVVLLASASGCGSGRTTANSPGVAGPFKISVGGRTLAGDCRGRVIAGRPKFVLEASQGNGSDQLQPIADALARSGLVCTYDRAGFGSSDPAGRSPRRVGDLVADLNAVLERKTVPRPYVLVGHSLGGLIVLLYMQRHPADIAGVVAMNPGPTYHDWLRGLRPIVTAEELRVNEIEPMSGNVPDEPVDVRESDDLLNEPFPQHIPYAVLFAEDCEGGTDPYCNKVVDELEATQRALARLSPQGRYVRVKGAGHEIYLTHLPRVIAAIDDVAARAK
jgi:pimeloyl-ACP methyl ester carboxylesterase